MAKKAPSPKATAIRALIGIALIIVNVVSGNYIMGALGILMLVYTVVKLVRSRSNPAVISAPAGQDAQPHAEWNRN
jgi:membrane-bound ClpP family serine protease